MFFGYAVYMTARTISPALVNKTQVLLSPSIDFMLFSFPYAVVLWVVWAFVPASFNTPAAIGISFPFILYTWAGAAVSAYDRTTSRWTWKQVRTSFFIFISVVIFAYAGFMLQTLTFLIANATQNINSTSESLFSVANIQAVLFNGIGYPVLKNIIMNRFQSTGTFQQVTSTNDSLRALVAKLQFNIMYGCFFELPGKIVMYRNQNRVIFIVSALASMLVDVVRRNLQATWIRSKILNMPGVDPAKFAKVPAGDHSVQDFETTDAPMVKHSSRSTLMLSQTLGPPPAGVLEMPAAGDEYGVKDYVKDLRKSFMNLNNHNETISGNSSSLRKTHPLNSVLAEEPADEKYPTVKSLEPKRREPQATSLRNSTTTTQNGKDDEYGTDWIMSKPKEAALVSNTKKLRTTVSRLGQTVKSTAWNTTHHDIDKLKKINTAFENYGQMKTLTLVKKNISTKKSGMPNIPTSEADQATAAEESPNAEPVPKDEKDSNPDNSDLPPPEPVDTASLKLVYTINSLTANFTEWVSRICAIGMVIIYVSYIPEAECNSRISVSEVFIRGACFLAIGIVVDMVGLSMEENIMKCSFAEGASALASIRIGWRTFALIATLQAAVIGAMISIEGGLLLRTPNQCFVQNAT
ncbi:hypothetical protein HDV05_003587 [Chytridiales sp. JEL 0842]|nr:hypothetical protein HDV05_003587 [Chytridiales sp. JEL 0842]